MSRRVSATVDLPPDRHWFVPDDTGVYCVACNLPRSNRRHAAKTGACE